MLSTLQMLDVLNPPALKEMGNYLEDEWLGSEHVCLCISQLKGLGTSPRSPFSLSTCCHLHNALLPRIETNSHQTPYTPYSQQLQHMPAASEPQSLPYSHASYLPPKDLPGSYAQATSGFTFASEATQPHPYEGLDLLPAFPAMHSPPPGSTVSSPNVAPRPGLDARRGQAFSVTLPPTPQGSHMLLSQSPLLHTPPTHHLLPSQSPLPATPQSAHLLPSQPVPTSQGPNSQSKSLKRAREDSDSFDSGVPTQRRRSRSASLGSRMQNDLSEEEQLLLKLKHEESLPWKDIAREFETRLGRSYQVPALQMRYKRLRERLRTWTEDDVWNHFL